MAATIADLLVSIEQPLKSQLRFGSHKLPSQLGRRAADAGRDVVQVLRVCPSSFMKPGEYRRTFLCVEIG